MPTVRDLLHRKKAHASQSAAAPPTDRVVMIDATATVLEAARLMTTRGIGGLMVQDADGQMTGIFTERDVLRRIVNDARDPQTTRVADVMTSPVLTVTPDATVAECRRLITERRIRHLPVMEHGDLCGVVTSGDLIAFEADEARATIEHLEGYVFSSR